MSILAELSGNITGIHVGLTALGSAVGVGLVGAKMVEAIGRNPSARTNILVMGILGMALAEGLTFIVLFLVK